MDRVENSQSTRDPFDFLSDFSSDSSPSIPDDVRVDGASVENPVQKPVSCLPPL